MRRVVVQVGGRRTWARTVNKDEAQVEGNVFHQFQGLLELALGLAREADDKVGAEAQIRTDGAQFADDGFVFQGGCSRVSLRSIRGRNRFESAGAGGKPASAGRGSTR